MFDVPPAEKCRLEWRVDLPVDDAPWSVGMIVGPSGSGKSTVLRHVWGEPREYAWGGASVIDDFDRGTLDQVCSVLSAVGFNTIPAWLRPHAVLSTGEKFRATVARHLLDDADVIAIDEFTSVVDRQVAKIASHAVQKYVRRVARRLVVATCHYDVIDWLQPDWVLDMATRSFTRRSLQRRPSIACDVRRVPYSAWTMFAPFHYLTASLHTAARCYALHVDGRRVAFAGVLNRPHPVVRDVVGVSRLVTLPDWQGVGLAMALVDALGAAYAATRKRLHTYPAHPALVRVFDRSAVWALRQKPNARSVGRSETKNHASRSSVSSGGRPCAVFEYVGARMGDVDHARRLLAGPS